MANLMPQDGVLRSILRRWASSMPDQRDCAGPLGRRGYSNRYQRQTSRSCIMSRAVIFLYRAHLYGWMVTQELCIHSTNVRFHRYTYLARYMLGALWEIILNFTFVTA